MSVLPDRLVLRTGGSNWRLFIPSITADITTNYQPWSPDAQFNNVNVAPSNEIAIQFSYFAAYWLNRNKAAVNVVYQVPVYGSGGTFSFRATTANPITSYQGLYTSYSGSYFDLTVRQDGIDAGYDAVTGAWNILLRTTGAKPAVGSMGNFQDLLANPAFKTMTVSTANGRKSFGDATGFYEGFFTTNKITRLALVDGTASLTNVTGNTNYIIYDLVETSGSETMFQILNRLDTYAGSNNMGGSDAPTFRSPSVVNYTAGVNGYSGTWSARSAAGAFSTSTFPDKICVCGINIASDDDIQFFAAYWGNLESGKADSWRGLNPSETLWSLWGNDWHTDTTASTGRRVSTTNGIQTSPGINSSVSGYSGDVYLLAFSSGAVTPSLVASQTIFYRKFVSGTSISFDVISSNAGAVSRTHESNDTAVVTIPTTATPSASIAGPGKTTIKVTQPATGNYTQVINNALITIVVVGQGKTYTSETFPSSFDLAGTNLTGSVFNSCNLTSANLTNANLTNSVFSGSTNLTSANLFGTTVNTLTDFTTSTLAQITSGRITGITSLLPAGFTMI